MMEFYVGNFWKYNNTDDELKETTRDYFFKQLEQMQTEKELDKELEAIPEQIVSVIIKPYIVESKKHLAIIILIQNKDITILKAEFIKSIYSQIRQVDVKCRSKYIKLKIVLFYVSFYLSVML